MLKISHGTGLSRRDFLTIGGLGCGGLALSSLLAGRTAASDAARWTTGRSVIFLFQQGGPSQFETFDPKPGADTQGPTRSIPTAVPGIRIAEHWTRTARATQDMSIIRSMTLSGAASP